MNCSSCEDWGWFGRTGSFELAKAGTDEYAAPWAHNAYRWFYDRLPDSKKPEYTTPLNDAKSVGPPERLVPLPAAGKNGQTPFEQGAIFFLSVDSNGSRDDENNIGTKDSVLHYACQAARYSYDMFRILDANVGYPRVELFVDEECEIDGGSLALPAMIAAVCRVLRIHVPDTIISTGLFETDSNSSELRPVAPNSLSDKIVAAVRYGYHKIAVVQGQLGAGGCSPADVLDSLVVNGTLPQDTVLEFFEVDPDPLLATFRIVSEIPDSAATELAGLLAIFDKRYLRSDPYRNNGLVFETVSPYLKSTSPLTRHVAADILRRRALHLGKTLEAEAWRKKTPELRPVDYPSGWLGSYLKYETAASQSVLKLDLGIWDDAEHDRADRILDRLKGNIQDGAADIEEVRSAMALANTKAYRLRFRGRLEESKGLFENAWSELVAFYSFWDDLFEYTHRMGLIKETRNRQLNQCLECQFDYWTLTGKVLPSPDELYPVDFGLLDNVRDAFDLVAWLHFRLLSNQLPSSEELERYVAIADSRYDDCKRYPNYLPYEKAILLRLGDVRFQSRMKQRLADAKHLRESLDVSKPFSNSITALLAIRTAFALECPDDAASVFERMDDTGNLKQIARRLLADPERIGFRCPY